jgi:hypothetical protein
LAVIKGSPVLRFLAASVGSLAAAVLPLGAGGPESDRPLAKAVTQRAEGFTPAKHGFHFRNLFRGSPLPAAIRNASSGPMKAVEHGLGAGLALPNEFGLCGGMSLAAADFYLAQRPIPDLTKPPEQGTPLYEYLYQRQAESMGPLGVMALKFWNWMKLPDHSDTGECTQKLTAQELPAIVSRLRARQLVPVGLVLQSSADGKLWENHQTLAYAVKEGDKGVVDLLVYDPNFPGDDKLIVRLTPVAKEKANADEYRCQRISGSGRTMNVRGLFVMPYEPKVPPEGLGK